MDSTKKGKHTSMYIAFVLVATILTDTVTWAQVYVEPNTALLNEGNRTDLLCRYNREINYCRIEIPGEKILILSPEWNKSPGFSYFGKGLKAGECGVSIDHVKGINNGQVKCGVGVEGEEFTGSMDLVVAIRPQQPIIELITRPERDMFFDEGRQFRARCIVRDGRPAANITWLLDNYPTDKGVSPPEIVSSQNGEPNGLATTIQEIKWILEAEDNNRKLICKSHHQTDRESVPPQEAAYTLHVRYRPVRKPEFIVYGLYLDHTALVNVTIRSNPTPVVEWNVDGNIIGQGQQNGRFSAYEPVHLGQDFYNVTLGIAGLTPEDTAKTYQLRSSNSLGSTDYQVRISSSSKPPLAGLDIGAIVGIVVAIAVLIIVVLLFVFAKVTNRWCFGEKSLKSPRPETILAQDITNAVITRHNFENEKLLRVPPQPRRSDVSGDSSFEYATDRESSVYNATTIPLHTSKLNDSQENAKDNGTNDLLSRGNQIGIPESRFSRWLPKDQREIIEKQAKLLSNRTQTPQTPPNATTIAARNNLSPPASTTSQTDTISNSNTNNNNNNTSRMEHMTAPRRPQLTETEI